MSDPTIVPQEDFTAVQIAFADPEFSKGDGYLLGATLGGMIRRLMPHRHTGNLARFCHIHLPNQVFAVGKSAPGSGDMVYFLPCLSGSAITTGWVKLQPQHTRINRALYSDPALRVRLAVDTESQTLWATRSDIAELPPDSHELPRPAVDLAEFMATLPTNRHEDYERAETIAASLHTPLTQAWSAIIHGAGFNSLPTLWLQWISSQIGKTIQSEPSWLSAFFESVPIESGNTWQAHSHLPADQSQKLDELRELVCKAVRNMSYDELRNLNLPFSTICDIWPGK